MANENATKKTNESGHAGALPESISGFEPVARSDAVVLILGSMPGEESLKQQQYYAHVRNGFWRIMMTLLSQDSGLPYAKRTDLLMAHGIALWDVLQSCVRPGSLDASIVSDSEIINDFSRFYSEHPAIRHVFFNGRKAEQVYRARVLPMLSSQSVALTYDCLPSTSPAMASLNFEQKLEQWRQTIRPGRTG